MFKLFEDLSNVDYKEKIYEFKDNLFKSKKYWILYLIFLLVVTLSTFTMDNYDHPQMGFIIVGLVAIFGVFSITFYYYNDDENKLYKTAFIIILLFGLICCFLNPICNVSDEMEHLVRSDITSQGVLMPEYVNGSFSVSSSLPDFYNHNRALTVYQASGVTDKINNTLSPYPSAFQHNPFFGYLPQAIGLIIAKLLDLNVIWLLWLGRICNLLFYSFIASYAIKKSPILKIPLIVTACIPVAIQQAASVSIDGMFGALGILTIAYFFSMFKSEEKSLDTKDILKFSGLCLLLGLCKLPFLASVLLLFCIPKKNFKNYNSSFYILLSIIIVGIIGILWTKYGAMPNYVHSWRADYYSSHNINSSQQIHFMLTHPFETLITIFRLPNSLGGHSILTGFSILYSAVPGASTFYQSDFIAAIFPMFIGAVWFLYPNVDKIEFKDKIGPLIILVIIYAGVSFSQIISWGSIGNLNDMVIHLRYFLPLLYLVPFIFGINYVQKRNYEVDMYIICLSIGFIASFLIEMVSVFY